MVAQDEYAHDDTADLIVGRSLLAAETLSDELRSSILAVARDVWPDSSGIASGFGRIENALDAWRPTMAQILVTSLLAADVAGRWRVWEQMTPQGRDALASTQGAQESMALPRGFAPAALQDVDRTPIGPTPGEAGGTPAPPGLFPPGDAVPEPMVRFPLIERAAEELAERQVLPRWEFDQLSRDARQRAFTVAEQASDDALATIRDVLSETVREGASLEGFRDRLGPALEGSFIGPAHLENVYRTNVQQAYNRAHDELASHPIVDEIFPYQEYLPIHDARTRPEHLDLGRLGLSGTGIYRRDDPMWDLFTPPWDYQCRCGVNLLTVEAAARKGVAEAIQWERTGTPPERPEWRLDFIPFRPRPGFTSGRAA